MSATLDPMPPCPGCDHEHPAVWEASTLIATGPCHCGCMIEKTYNWNAYQIGEGDEIQVLTARGEWINAVALSGVVRGDRFPVVWADTTGDSRTPWPVTMPDGSPTIRPRQQIRDLT